MAFWRAGEKGLVLAVRLTPRASRDGIDGAKVLDDGREVLVVRVRALPHEGAANEALVKVIATAFGRPKSAVTIASGATQRVKQVSVAGDAAALAEVAARLK
jgi:uncharacterized protein (TIGR00251 family)